MNLNSVLNMVVRMLLRRAVSHGVKAGIDMASRKGRGKGAPPSAGEAEQAKAGRDTARRAKQAMRVARRVGRF